jgi:hypothetical protein
MRVWRKRVALALVTWLLLELTAFAGLVVLRRARGIAYKPLAASTLTVEHRALIEKLLADDTAYIIWSATLGWTHRPNGASALYRANAQGIRADREYAPVPAQGMTRIAAFGDSFTHGDDVANGATWAAVLERIIPRLEVLNFGVSAYGLDQAYLRWREVGRGFHPHVVLIGYLTEDILRHVNVYRPFHTPKTRFPLAKPRFQMRADMLVLEPNPVGGPEDYRALLVDPARGLHRFGMHDYYYQHRPHAAAWDRSAIVRMLKLVRYELLDALTAPVRNGMYNEASEAFAVTTRLFDRFVEDARAEHAMPLIVVFPTREDFRRRADGRASAYQALLGHFTRKGYVYVDVLDAFPECRSGCDLNAIIPAHFSVEGNRVIAEFLAGELRARGLAGR